MLKLQRALRERNFAMTHLDLLRAAHPTLANCYSTVLKRDLTPSQRFQAISEKLFSFSEFVGQLDSHERMTQLPAVSSVIDASTNQQRGPPVLLIDRLKGFFNSKKTEMAIKKMVGDATAATFAASGNLPQLMTTLQSADSKYVSLSISIKNRRHRFPSQQTKNSNLFEQEQRARFIASGLRYCLTVFHGCMFNDAGYQWRLNRATLTELRDAGQYQTDCDSPGLSEAVCCRLAWLQEGQPWPLNT